MSNQTSYRRFNASQRAEHMLLVITFIGLALTGVPQRYAGTGWGEWTINMLGGIESIRIVHRIMAIGLMLGSILHGGIVSYKWFVYRMGLPMIPSLRDLRDAQQWVSYNMGWRDEHPKMPRFNFGEKVEYLAVVWGTVVMIMTGFMMWNPIATSRLLPGSFIPAAVYAHSAEALLAVVSIIIWHMYNVHVRRFNRSMFTGDLPRDAMEEEHGEELERIERGDLPQPPPADVIIRRRNIFIPFAILMTSILLGGLIWFTSFEDTALETVPSVLEAPNQEALLVLNTLSGDAENGENLWVEFECQKCHGDNAEGAPGALNVALANTSLDLETFGYRVRTGPADMPAYLSWEISSQELADLYAWLQTQP